MREKIAYGLGGLGGTLSSGSDDRLLLPVFVSLLHVSPALISSFQLLYRLWDAVTDLLLGWMSDNTRSRWGRRRPYMLLGTVLLALFLPLFWLVNPEWSLTTIIIWMGVGQLLLIAAGTIWNIPFQSLLFEFTPSSVERTNVAAVRSYVSKIGLFALGWIWWLTQLPIFNGADGKPDILKGAFWISVVVGIIVLICGTTAAVVCRERYFKTIKKTETTGLWLNLKLTLSNRPFQLLAVILLFFTLGTTLNNSFTFYLRLYYVAGGDTQLAATLSGWGSTVELVTGFAAIPVIQWAARRYGKRASLIFVMSLVGLTGVSTLFTLNPDYPYLMLITNFIAAPTMTAIWILIPSITSDIVDHEELKSGVRREGAFAAVFSWLFKLAMSIATVFSGFIIVWSGFDAKLGADQAEGAMTNIRLILVLISAVTIPVAVAVCCYFPLTTRRIEEIRVELEARRGEV